MYAYLSIMKAMHVRYHLGAALLGAACIGLVGAAPAPAGERPVVVELYTHPSCPETGKAAAEIEALFARPDVLGLVMPVDLWGGFSFRGAGDEGGAAFRERQNAYARALHVWPVATPQVVIDGVAVGNPRRLEAVEAEIAERRRTAPDTVHVVAERSGAAARIAVTGAPETAEVWLAVVDRAVGEAVRGVDGAHVVSRLEPLGPAADYADGAEIRALAPIDARAVILVQDGPGGPILAAAVLEPLNAVAGGETRRLPGNLP